MLSTRIKYGKIKLSKINHKVVSNDKIRCLPFESWRRGELYSPFCGFLKRRSDILRQMKKKGFTLIELLAVIVILAIIALIATPMIMGVIENVRKQAALRSVNGLLEAAEYYQFEENDTNVIDLTSDVLTIQGSKPDSGMLFIDAYGNMRIIAKYGKYCIEKKYDETSPSIVNEESCDELKIKIYGIKRKIDSADTKWERINDSIGLVANAQIGETTVQNDFDNIYPWSDIISYNYDTTNNQVTAYYGDTNFKFDGSNGEVLTKIPEFYYKRYQEGDYEYILISKRKIAGYEKSEEFSVGRYTMSLDNNKVHSKSGVQPLGYKTITDFRNYAQALGTGFGQMDYHYFILQMLYLVEYADYNSQSTLGQGYTYRYNVSAIASGGCDNLGMKSGTLNNDEKHSVIYRGIEDIFGNVWQFVDGINIKDKQAYICYDQSKYESDKFDGCYKPLGYMNATSDGWTSKLGYDSNHAIIALPTAVDGSNSTYISGYYWRNTEERIALVGGHWDDNIVAGLWSWNVSGTSSLLLTYVGGRLIKIS